MKKCPYCAELIQDEAVYCRYCRKDIPRGLSNPNVIAPKFIDTKSLPYEYSLDAERINNNRNLSELDLLKLAYIAAQSYSLSEELINHKMDISLNFIKSHHMPALMGFNYLGVLPNITEQYLTYCSQVYTGLGFIIIGAQTERLHGNLSTEEADGITKYVVTSAVLSFSMMATILENSVNAISDERFDDITNQWNDTFIPALNKYVKDELLSSLLYFDIPTSKQVVDGQTPFILELKRIINVFNR